MKRYVLVILLAFCLRDIPDAYRGFPGFTYIHEACHVAAASFEGVGAYIKDRYTTVVRRMTPRIIYGGYVGEVVIWGLLYIIFLKKAPYFSAIGAGVITNIWLTALRSTDFEYYFEIANSIRWTWFIVVGLIVFGLWAGLKRRSRYALSQDSKSLQKRREMAVHGRV